MNICFLSSEYPPETGWGGIGTYTYHMARALADSDNEVHVISQATDRKSDYMDGKVHMHRIKVESPRVPSILPEFRNRLNYSTAVYRELNKIIDRVDIVESPEWWAEGFWYSLKKKTPLITKLHTPFYMVAKFNALKINMDIRLAQMLEKRLVLNSDMLTSPSKSLAQIVAKDYKIDPGRIEVAPYPIHMDFFKPADFMADKKSFSVLYVGRKEGRKGVDVLCKGVTEILKQAPNTKFTFIGGDTNSGPNNTSFERYLLSLIPKEAKKSVSFIDFIEKTKLVDYYQKSDICVFPSIYENFPYTCLEAMACGKAIIASNVGGFPEMLLDKKCGLLVPPGDPEAISSAIIKLIEDENLREQLGRAARRRVEEKYSPEKIARATLAVYEKAIEKSK